MYPTDRLYSKDHEWIKIDGEVGTLGITEYAQDELGEVVFVELPEVGQSYDAAEEIGTIESVKAVAEVFSPVAGEIVEVNEALEDKPELVNEGPHEGGWLVKIKLAGAPEGLMDSAGYEAFVAGESA